MEWSDRHFGPLPPTTSPPEIKYVRIFRSRRVGIVLSFPTVPYFPSDSYGTTFGSGLKIVLISGTVSLDPGCAAVTACHAPTLVSVQAIPNLNHMTDDGCRTAVSVIQVTSHDLAVLIRQQIANLN